MNEEEIKLLRGDSVDEIVQQFGDLSDGDLSMLKAQEEADNKPRSTLIARINDELANRAEAQQAASKPGAEDDTTESIEDAAAEPTEDDTTEPTEQVEAGGKEERGEVPDWQKPDYTGPMTITIADWRRKHLTLK